MTQKLLPVPIADIADLVRPADKADACTQWSNVVPFLPAEMSAGAKPALWVNAGQNVAGLQAMHQESAPIQALELNFLRDVTVSGHFYPFHNDAFLDDGSEPSRINQHFAAAEGRSARDLVYRTTTLIAGRPALIIGGPGYPIWGHWLLDFLPRLAIAKSILGHEIANFVIPIPSDTPAWVFKLAAFFCDVGPDMFLRYNRESESVSCAEACIPTFAHANYFLHSFLRSFYQSFWHDKATWTPRRICISRKAFGQTRNSVVRVFAQEDYFEATARRHGFATVFPETLDFRGQIDLFCNATTIVGQYGSAMHSALFARPGTLVGQFCLPNTIQSRIAGLCDLRSAYLMPDHDENDAEGVRQISVSASAINEFFDKFCAVEA